MTVFLWVMLVLMALSAAMKLKWLAKGQIPARTPKDLAIDVFGDAALCAWAVVLLVQQ
jgi:hypothetical protein